MFADDTNLFFSDKSLTNLEITVNTELEKINIWFKLNKLSLNVKKTKYILFSSKGKSNHSSLAIKIENSLIEEVHNTKFLGVIINQTLTWNDHIRVVQQKINKNSGIIRKISKSLPHSVLINLYHTLVEPYLAYCNIVWGISRTTFLEKLFISQKKIIRIITLSKYNTHTKPLFARLSLLTVYQLNDFQVACFVYRCVHNILPSKFCSMFCTNDSVHSYITPEIVLNCTLNLADYLLDYLLSGFRC